jgi:FkbM family methyltransferase
MGRLSMRRAAAHSVVALLGRRNTVRLGRLLLNEARLDVPNDMASNGELLVQRDVVNAASRSNLLVVADVGANVGDWTAAFNRQAKNASVRSIIHAFEPDDTAASRFASRQGDSAGSQGVVLNRVALSDHTGHARLHIASPAAGTNSLHAAPSDVDAPTTTTVRLETLDEYANHKNIDRFVLVKVDTEGHDLPVMRGASALFAEGRIDVCQFEYNHRWISARQFLSDAFEFALGHRYRIGKVTPKGIEFYERWHSDLETFVEGNFIVCKADLAGIFRQVEWWNAKASSS